MSIARIIPLADDGTFTCPCGAVTTWMLEGLVTPYGSCPACGRGFVFGGHCLITESECLTKIKNPK